MLGVGWTEMLVIGVVALIVIGPKDLPVVMGRIGKFAATIRRMGSEFQRELNKTTGLNEITNLRNSVTAPLKATADAIRKEFNTTTSTGAVQPSGALKPADPKVESVVDEIKAAAGMTPAAPAAPAMTPLVTPAPELSITAVPAKPKRTPRVKVPAVTPVAVADIPPAAKPAKTSKKPIESPAPVEAIAPAKVAKPAAKAAAKPAEAKPAATKTAATKTAATKTAAPKPKTAAKAETVTKAPAAKVATKAAPAAKAKPKAAAPAAEPAAPVVAKKPAARKKT